MTEPVDGLINDETALAREVEILCEKYPQLSREDLEREVRTAYEQLRERANVGAHLIALTRAQVMDRLRERGLHVDPVAHRIDQASAQPTQDATSDEDGAP